MDRRNRRILAAMRATAVLATAVLAVLVPGAGRAAPADGQQAVALLGRGAAAFRLGDVEQAARDWTEAIRFCQLAGDARLEGEARVRRGEALKALGLLPRAVEDLARALALAESSGDPAAIAAAAGALGNAYFLAREPALARPLIERSLDLARRQRLTAVIAASANNLGNLLAGTGDAPGAIAAYQQAVSAAEAAGDAALAATALTNQARAEARRGRDGAVEPLLTQAHARLEREPASRAKVFGLVAIGRQAMGEGGAVGEARPISSGRVRLAYQALRAAAMAADELGDRRANSLAHGYLGELYERQGRVEESQRLTAQAVFLAQEVEAHELLYRWQWQSGRLLRAKSDLDGAIGAYRRAVFSLQRIRQDIPVEYRDGRSSFRETLGPLFYGLADLLLQRSARAIDRKEADPLLTEARDTVELLKAAELQDYFKDECVASLQARAANIEQISSRTAGVYPIILPDRLELLVSLPDGRRQVTVQVDQQRLTAEARTFRQLLEKRTTREFLLPATQLYDWLIRPLEPLLQDQKVDTLVFLPDGPLRTIPMAALFDGEKFLVAKYATATAPGLTLIDPKPIRRQNLQVLLSGLSESVQGYPGLPNVQAELEAIKTTMGGQLLENESFRLARFEQELKQVPFSVVHIASHGEFESDPDKSFLLTFDGKLTMGGLERVVKFGEFRDEPLELLTLSACRTAAGDDRAALGLAGVAIKSGARSALASLWFTSDEAASALVQEFYEQLKTPSITKAKALQQAQLKLLNDRRLRHPGYWAAFLMIGNWL